jgi:hypothetical protein
MEIYTEICKRCNGRGFLLGSYNNKPIGILCSTCWGVGYLDWIQKIIGAKFSCDIIERRVKNIEEFTKKGIPWYLFSPESEKRVLEEFIRSKRITCPIDSKD